MVKRDWLDWRCRWQ